MKDITMNRLKKLAGLSEGVTESKLHESQSIDSSVKGAFIEGFILGREWDSAGYTEESELRKEAETVWNSSKSKRNVSGG